MKNFFSIVGMSSELLAVFEARRFRREVETLLAELPQGDGHPVIVVPGLGADDNSTADLRNALQKLGYTVYGWGLGINKGPSDHVEAQLDNLLIQVYRRHGCKVSLIGWSMGGILAREMARYRSRWTRRIILLASPFAADVKQHLSYWVLRMFCHYSGYSPAYTQQQINRTRRTPAVMCTAIYTRGDAVVNWRACLEADVPHAENVEVTGTHWGMVHNLQALRIMAHRLPLPDTQLN